MKSRYFQRLFSLMMFACLTANNLLGGASESCPSVCKCKNHDTIVICYVDLTEIPYNIPTAVKYLDLSSNSFDSISDTALRNLPNLKVLMVNNSDVVRIGNNAFMNLGNLEVLDLSDNQLEHLSVGVFSNLKFLQVLLLDGNSFQIIPDLMYPRSLIKLSLGGGCIESSKLPSSLQQLTSLRDFALSVGNDVPKIDDSDLKWLTSSIEKISIEGGLSVDLGGSYFCRYTRLQEVSWQLSSSKYIRFDSMLRTLKSLSSCVSVETLSLGTFNGIAELSADTFRSLKNLSLETLTLNFFDSCIINNGTFQYVSHLKTLALNSYESTIVRDTTSMNNLRALTLMFNQMTDVPKLDLPSLETLDLNGVPEELTGNPYKRVLDDICNGSKFTNLVNLTNLSITNSGIGKLDRQCLSGLHNLRILDLSYNKLREVYDENIFSHVPKLESLNLNSNMLAHVDISVFFSLHALRTLYLSGNQMRTLDRPTSRPGELRSLETLDLTDNSLGLYFTSSFAMLRDEVFDSLVALKTLILAGNTITSLPAGLLSKLPSLMSVDLSNNNIVTLDTISFPSSSFVDFSRNRVSVISPMVIKNMSSNSRIDLTDNPFACSCDLIPFLKWIAEKKINESTLPGLSEYLCDSPTSMHGKRLLDIPSDDIVRICFPPPWKIIVIAVASSVAFIMTLCGFVVYRFRWFLRLQLYYVSKRCSVRSQPDGYQDLDNDEYDLMVSYFANDEGGTWVRDILVPTIDKTERTRQSLNLNSQDEILFESDGYILFYEERDVTFNKPLIGAINDAMQTARKVMLVITEGYLQEGRCRFEMEQAVYKSCSAGHGVDDVIVVLFDESLGMQLLGSLPRSLKMDKVLHWTPNDENGKKFFWQKLKDRMS